MDWNKEYETSGQMERDYYGGDGCGCGLEMLFWNVMGVILIIVIGILCFHGCNGVYDESGHFLHWSWEGGREPQVHYISDDAKEDNFSFQDYLNKIQSGIYDDDDLSDKEKTSRDRHRRNR